MSCEEPVITPGGRRGLGVSQPQSGLDFPLVNPSDDVRYLVADFYLAYDDPGFYSSSALRQHPLRIKWLYGVGCEPSVKPVWAPAPVHEADILVVDANGATVFDSTQLAPGEGEEAEFRRFLKRSWGDDYDIYEWIGNRGVCRLVAYKTWPGDADATFDIEPKNWPTHLAPTRAVLDERAVYRMPKRLRSLKAEVAGVQLGATIRRRGAVLVADHNMEIAVGGTSGAPRQNTDIVFSAEPGSGTGKYNNCPDLEDTTRPIYRINGASANQHGDFILTAEDCLFVRQGTNLNENGTVSPVRSGGHATLTLGSDCGPCCDCPDYAFTATYMNNVALRYKEIGRRTHDIKLLHEQNIDRWVEQRECRLQRPLRVQMTAQNCPNIDVVAMYCNQCQQCAENVVLTVTFSTFPALATGSIVCGYTTLHAPGYPGVEYKMLGTWPVFTVALPPIDVGNSAYVKFRLRISPRTYPYAVTATITGVKNNEAIRVGCDNDGAAASATSTAALNCDASGGTLSKC